MEDGCVSLPASSEGAAVKRTSMACTACRQVKLRCDATRRFPGPCSRCEKQQRSCLFDPAFKRRRVRGALEKVIEENQHLHRLVDSIRDSSSGVPEPPDGEDSRLYVATSDDAAIQPEIEADAVPYEPHPSSHVLSQTSSRPRIIYNLYEALVDSQTAEELFGHFMWHYHPHLPLLDTGKSLASLHDISSLLFWGIMITSAREHPNHRAFYSRLLLPFKKLLSQTLLTGIRSVHTIQALLLLCNWPLPVINQKDDPSWNYCGMAVAAILQLSQREYADSSKANSSVSVVDGANLRRKTWLCCFVVSTAIAADLGLPPPMAMVCNLEPGLRRHLIDELPASFISQLEIQSYAIRTALALNNLNAHPFQNSLLDIIERDLDTVESRLSESMSADIQLEILAARLRLYSFPLLSKHSTGERRNPDTITKSLWLKGFHVASEISRVFSNSIYKEQAMQRNASSPTQDRASSRPTIFYPKRYHRTLAMSGMYLLRILALENVVSSQDTEVAHHHIKKVHQTLVHWSREEHDEGGRAAQMISFLLRHVQDQSSSTHFRDAESHPSPNIVDDGIRIAQRIRSSRRPQTAGESPGEAAPNIQQTSILDPTTSETESASFPGDSVFGKWETWFSGGDDIFGLFRPAADLSPFEQMS